MSLARWWVRERPGPRVVWELSPYSTELEQGAERDNDGEGAEIGATDRPWSMIVRENTTAPMQERDEQYVVGEW
jgi:hypothetical protein